MILRVYIQTDEMTEYEDITDDVTSIGNVSERLEASEFQTGTYRVSDFSFTVINRNGRYSDVGNVNSIFLSRRTNTKVKLTYSEEVEVGILGFARCGYVLCGNQPDIELTIFEGLLSDEASTESVENQTITFKVLGYQTSLDRTLAPTISVGQSFSTIITNCLTTAGFTVDSISVGNNQTIDAWTLENPTCKQVLDLVLSASDSVMRIIGPNAVIENRATTKATSKSFYGQASTNGVEDIISISQASNGLSRVYNYVAWKDTALYDSNASSITKYGIRKKELDFDFITNTTKRNNILASVISTLGEPKKEFDITVPLDYENVMLNMLDTVNVDYPTPLFAPIGQNLAIYGIATYGLDVYPYGDFTITIAGTDIWKIQSRQLNFNQGTITLKLRLI